MTLLKTIRSTIATLFVGAVLATSLPATQAYADSGAPASALENSVNILAMRDQFFAANPGAKSFNIMKHKNKGFKFYRNGTIVQVAQGIGRQHIQHKISSANPKEVCIPQLVSNGKIAHTGGCMTLAKVDGQMMFFWKFNSELIGPKSWKARFLK
jgi:hypothetical protein